MGPLEKSIKFRALGAALALLILAVASLDPGPPQDVFHAARTLPDPGRSCLLPVGGGAALIELPLLVPPATGSPGPERSGAEIKGPAHRIVPAGASSGHAFPVRHTFARQKRAGLFCGLPVGANAPPPRA